jgi:hypothetical protein
MLHAKGTWAVVAVVVLGLAAVGCSSSDTASPKAKEGKILDKAATAAGGPGAGASSAACQTDYDTLETAVETYRVAEDAEPKTIDDIVPAYLREAPPEWKIATGPDAKAQIVPTAAGIRAGCKAPSGG